MFSSSPGSVSKMIQFVVLGLLCSAAVISAAPPDVAAGRNLPAPPNAVAEARRLVHQADWASVGTISTYKSNAGLPMVSVVSVADSKAGDASTGNIYFVLLDPDLPALDIAANNKVTFMFSDAQVGECKEANSDPMGHNCPRAMVMGEVQVLEAGTDEYKKGLEAYVDRHSFAKRMPHGFKLCKLNISNVVVFSGYTGYRDVAPEDYYRGQ